MLYLGIVRSRVVTAAPTSVTNIIGFFHTPK